MAILTVAVAGLAIATLRYQPTAPEERSIYSPTTTTTPAGRWLAPRAAVETPLSSTEPPPLPVAPPTSVAPTPVPEETFLPTQTFAPAPIAPLTPTSSAPTPTSSTFSPRRNTNPTELPNGGRRFGTVQP